MLGADVVAHWRGAQPRCPRSGQPRRPWPRRGRAGPSRTGLGRGRREGHDRLRRAALLRGLQRWTEDGGSRPGRPRHGPRAPRRPTDRRSTGHVGRDRGQSGPRRRARDRCPDRRRLRPRRPAQRRAADHARLRRRDPGHARGGLRVRPAREAMQPVERRFDVVVTTNSGYPLDQNLYQAVKGMSAGADRRQPRRHDHLRGGVPRRPARPWLVWAAARQPAVAGRAPGDDRGLSDDHPRPVAGPDPGAHPDGQAGSCSRPTGSPRTRSGQPTSSRSTT